MRYDALRGALLLLAVSGAAAAGGCSRGAPLPFNLLLISVDTLRSGHMGAYGYERATTPHIDSLARSGTVFEQVMSPSPWTLPSHASLLTGLYPSSHGLEDDGVRLEPGIPTLAQALQGCGYHTIAVISHVYVSSAFALDRGFEAFDDSLIMGGAANPIAEQVVDRFLEVMGDAPRRPYFAFLHFFDPHWDYAPPPPFDTRFTDPGYRGIVDGTLSSLERFFAPSREMPEADREHAIALYDGEIAYLDAQVGRLLSRLRELGRLERTVVVLTSDHGEEFKEHGQLGHARTLYREVLSVPLVISGHPAFSGGTRRTDLVSPVDVAPTLLDLAGCGDTLRTDGVSLVGAGAESRGPLFSESIRMGLEIRAARHAAKKLIEYPQVGRRLLYDLASDPGETRPTAPDPTAPLSRALSEHTALADRGWQLEVVEPGSDELQVEATLRSAGRFEELRRYFSENVSGVRARFSRFELSQDGHELRFALRLSGLAGRIRFETDPPDADVTFEVALEGAPGAGLYVGGVRLPTQREVTLRREDPRLRKHADLLRTGAGVYIRAGRARSGADAAAELSPEAVDRLRRLGYAE